MFLSEYAVIVRVCVSETEKRQTAALGVNMMLLVLYTQTAP